MANVGEFFRMLEMLDEEDRESRQLLRIHRRHLRDTFNPFEMPEVRFVEIFRLSRDAAQYVIHALQANLLQTHSEYAIAVHLKVLTTLNFYASGSYQRRVGQDFTASMSQTMVCRCIDEVTMSINNILLPIWVTFPIAQEKRNAIKARFMEATNFPGIIGCVDGTHVALVTPTIEQQEHLYVNRKSYHSINVMVVCDYDLRILSINAQHPGGHHDSFIWKQSAVYRELERRYRNGEPRNEFILGDSGYSPTPWLLTPKLGEADGTPGADYTKAHCSTRNCVERCIGVAKGMLRCLLKERTLHYSPLKAGLIINACAVVHNIARHYRMPLPPLRFDEGDIQQLPAPVAPNMARDHDPNLFAEGIRVRDTIIRNRFT